MIRSIDPKDHLCLPATTTNFATSSCASGEAEVLLVAGVMWHVAHAALRSCAWPARSHEYRKCTAHWGDNKISDKKKQTFCSTII